MSQAGLFFLAQLALASNLWPLLVCTYMQETSFSPNIRLEETELAKYGAPESEAYFKMLADKMPHLVWILNPDGHFLFTNCRWHEYTGRNNDAKWEEIVHPDDWANSRAAWRAAFDAGKMFDVEIRLLKFDGSYRWFLGRAVPLKDNNGKIIKWFGTHTDIDEQKKAQEALMQYASFVANSYDAIFGKNLDGIITSWNNGAQKLYGYTPDEIVGKPVSKLMPFDTPHEMGEIMKRIAAGEEIQNYEAARVAKDGRIITVALSISPTRDSAGKIIGATTVARDVTQRKEVEQLIQHQAKHDGLTGLPNRTYIEERLADILVWAKDKVDPLAVMFLDLDRFKMINDTLGHAAGDKVLKEVANRLRNSIKDIDVVGRLGGDEFIFILPQIKSPANAGQVAKRIIKSLEAPIRIEDENYHISGSIGIAIYPNDGTDGQTLLKNADTALYGAKEGGRAKSHYYNSAMNVKAAEKLYIENDLRGALRNGELKMRYQPILEAKTNRITGVEALLRWNHPEFGMLLPHDFISVAEETGLIVPIGHWVIQEVCTQIKHIHDLGYKDLKVTVNLSARQFSEGHLVEAVTKLVRGTGLDPECVGFEITESVAVRSVNQTTSKLKELNELGAEIIIDDFGIGYSSLKLLRRFPIDMIKIDKSFIRNCINDEQDATIIKAIVSMAHNLGLKVVGEGVENEAQARFLSAIGCDYMQGFLFSQPLDFSNLVSFLREKYFSLFG